MELKRTLRYFILRFKRLKGEPKTLAKGVAVGLFVGVTPTIPLHTILTLAFAVGLRASKIAAFLASWLVSNPLTVPFQYYAAWLVGNWFWPDKLSWARVKAILDLIKSGDGFLETLSEFSKFGFETLLVLNIGGFMLAFPLSICGYFISLNIFEKLEKKREIKTKKNSDRTSGDMQS